MAIRFQCPHCQGLMSISSRRIGAMVPCPTCQHDVLVPDRDMFEAEPVGPQLAPGPAQPPPMPEEPLRLVGDAIGAQADTRDELPLPDGPSLVLRFAEGRRQALPLSKLAPVTIGRQSFNDVCVSSDSVAPLHCRIGWNRTSFEVTAATPQGVEVNGTVVEQAPLSSGDIVRVGGLDVIFHDPSAPQPPPAQKKKERGKPAATPPRSRPAAPEPSLFEGPVYVESSSNLPIAELDDAEDDLQPRPSAAKSTAEADGVVGRIWSELDGARRRPGEQDPLRSPTILALSIGASVLLLIAASIWFLIGREQRLRLFDLAESELSDGKYAQAIEHFQEFLKRYPAHRQSRDAAINLGKARVLKEMSGAAPSWDIAWRQLDELVQAHRNTADYRYLQPLVRDYAEQIAIGSARTAEATRSDALLEVTAKATALMERSADPDTPQTGPLEIIRTATERARLAIGRQMQLDATVQRMQAALAAKQPIAALSERAALLRRFPEFSKEGRIRETLQKALALEQQQIAAVEVDRAAFTDDPAQPVSVTPVFHTRSRSDDTSLGQVVFLLGGDLLYAVDMVTGEPVWRRAVGASPPFFPVTYRGAVHGVLVWDGRRHELVLLRVDSGTAVWRQPLEQPPVPSPPCIVEGQIYLATQGGFLDRFDAETGRHTARLKFSQELAGSPVLAPDKQHLFVAGDRGVLYALRSRPLEMAALTFTDHGPKAVRAPLVLLGRMLLLCDNDQGTSARLRLWDATQPAAALTEIGEGQRVPGAIYEAPVVRGSQLVVSSSGERLAAFAANDEPGRMELALIGQYRLQDGYGGPQYLMLGPDQQFWVSSSAFRRFEIGAESLRMDPNAVAIGLTTQPLQAIGETFFVSRRPVYGSAAIFTNIDRDRMAGTWRLAVGAAAREILPSAGGGATIVTDSGLIYRVSAARLAQGGMEFRNGVELEVPAELRDPLLIGRLHDGRVVLAAPLETPKCWFVDAEGRIANGPAFDRRPQCPPLLLDEGLVWPSSGRLQLRALSGNRRFDDWRAGSDDDQPSFLWLLRTGPLEFLAALNDGALHRFQVRMGDVPHLAAAASTKLDLAPGIHPVLIGDSLACALADGSLLWLHVRTLDAVPGVKLPGKVRWLQTAENQLIVQLEDHTLALCSAGEDGAIAWQISLKSFRATGKPHLVGDALWLADVEGQVVAVNLRTGAILQQRQCPQPLGPGIYELGSTLWAAAVDGTLYRVDSLSEVNP